METTTGSRSASLGWKLLLLIPLAVGVVLAVIGSRQTDLHAGNKLTIIANLFVAVFLHRARGALDRGEEADAGLGILALIVASTVLGFGLHVLLRVLTH